MADGAYSSFEEVLEDYLNNGKKVNKKPIKVVKSYEYQKSMLYAIQTLTGQQTHEIIANLVEEADKHLKESNIDVTLKPRDNESRSSYGYRSSERRCQKYMFYPGTELYVGIYVTYTEYGIDYHYDEKGNRKKIDAFLKYNFKLPSSSIKMDQKEYDDYITDGILCDASKNVEKPEMKGTLTKEEIEIREAQRKERARAKAAAKRAAKKKSKKLIR